MREALDFGKITDFGKTAHDYGRYRTGFPDAFFERLVALGIGRKGQRVVDLGTGTGTVARGLASRGCDVTGVDKSAELIEEAKRLDAEAGVSVHYVVAPAEEMGLADTSFDAVTAAQCWHWFERPRVAREARRVLVDDGSLVIAHLDWLPFAGNVVERTEHLIRKHNPKWNLGSAPSAGTGLYPQWLTDVAEAGFTRIETFSFDIDVPYSHEGWRGRIRASAGVGESLVPDAVERFDAELARILAEHFPAGLFQVPHRVWAVVCRSPGSVRIQFEVATDSDMPSIEECVRRFRLDDEHLKADQFIVLKRDDRIVAFGRIKPYGRGVYELGCVAVLEEERGSGLGKRVVRELIRRFPVPDIYITTDLPSYFESFGFKQISEGPPEIRSKIQRICGRLRSGVVAMALRKEMFT